jgi:phosphate transport system substrate-binding protein
MQSIEGNTVKLQRFYVAGIAMTAAFALTACGSDNTESPSAGGASAAAGSCVDGQLTAQGSSAQKNAMDEWIKTYQGQCANAKIAYEGTGSGAGIEAFIAGTADFAGSDSALKEDQKPQADAKCAGGEAIDLPMVVGPVAVVYNVDGVDNLQLSAATIAKIFAGKAKTWNDASIAADNPGVTLPSTAIATVHRSDESGTTDNFTKYLSKSAEKDWTFGNAKAWKAPGGQGAKGSDGVAQAVKSTAGSLSYVELSFAENSDLKKAKVKNGAGEYTELTGESAGKTIAGAKVKGTAPDLALDIDYNTTEAGAYPIVLVTYEIVCSKGSAKAAALKGFLTYTSSTGGQAALSELGYAPLPESVRTKVASAVAAIA